MNITRLRTCILLLIAIVSITACDNLNADERGLVRATFINPDGSPAIGMYVELSSRFRQTTIESVYLQKTSVPSSASILGNGITDANGTVEFVTLLDDTMRIYGLKEGKVVTSVAINNFVDERADYTIIIPEVQIKTPAQLNLSFSNQSGRTDDFIINISSISRENCPQIWDGNSLTDNLSCFDGSQSFEIIGGQEIPDISIETVFPGEYRVVFLDAARNVVESEVVLTSINMTDEIIY